MKRHAARVLALLALACAIPRALPAAEPAATPATFQVPKASPDLGGAGAIVPYFLLLLVLAGGGIYVLNNGLPVRGLRNAAGRKLQIAEMRSLGSRQFLVVVEYEDSRMLLGVTPGKIDYLCPLESRAPAEFSALVPEGEKPNEP
jgi:flagellar biogenesis protein FliO